ncbi:hypothetical protein ACS0TY_009626 [Phlomoides rotata]
MTSSTLSWRRINLCLIFSICFFLMNSSISCIDARPGRMMIVKEDDDDDASSMALKYFQEKEKSRYDGLYFTKLPKGVPIPPSGPSPRHNSSPEN